MDKEKERENMCVWEIDWQRERKRDRKERESPFCIGE